MTSNGNFIAASPVGRHPSRPRAGKLRERELCRKSRSPRRPATRFYATVIDLNHQNTRFLAVDKELRQFPVRRGAAPWIGRRYAAGWKCGIRTGTFDPAAMRDGIFYPSGSTSG
jgi:hypothetical protein